MSGLLRREQLELCLRADLEQAEEQFRKANPGQQSAARDRFEQALNTFSALILKGELPQRRPCA